MLSTKLLKKKEENKKKKTTTTTTTTAKNKQTDKKVWLQKLFLLFVIISLTSEALSLQILTLVTF